MELLVEITVTDRCNKRCSYCFEKQRIEGKETFDEWKPRVLKACEDVAAGKLSGYNSVQLTFWGGEPFIRYDRMLDLIGLTSKYGFVSYYVYTNGTLRRETESFINDSRFKDVAGRFFAQVSYDGSPCNERRRGYGIDEIRGQVEAFRKAGAGVSLKATVCGEDVCMLPELWDSYESLVGEWPDLKYSPTIDSMWNPSEAPSGWKDVVAGLCRREYGFFRKHGRFLMSWFDDVRPRLCRLSGRVFLHSDGGQYVCHGCPYVGDCRLRLGSVDDEIKFIPQSRPQTGGCSGCCATYCVYCNAAGVPAKGGLSEAWNAGRGRSVGMCQMYKTFGWYRRALMYGIIRSK